MSPPTPAARAAPAWRFNTPCLNQPDGVLTKLVQIDREFEPVGCLGHGGFGSVFLARKSVSRRRVALKFVRFEVDGDRAEEEALFFRELDTVLKLDKDTDDDDDSDDNNANSSTKNKHLSIIHFEDWFTGPNFACLVMNYADGGTLAREIETKLTRGSHGLGPYTERRVAAYALQLSDALAFAHGRGIAHHDVKSANVLIDQSNGGKLLLCDWGSAVTLGEESVRMTEIYASPEVLEAYRQDDFTGLDHTKLDSFGLGCILYEMLCCQKLVDITSEDQTLAEFIKEKKCVEAALDLPCVKVGWLPPNSIASSSSTTTTSGTPQGYSHALRSMIRSLLELDPRLRYTPTELGPSLRQDPNSPLLTDHVRAAQGMQPGAPVTIDNIQLGMFVQRGRDWTEGVADGGPGSVGVVVKLDSDVGYAEVVFPHVRSGRPLESLLVRIGARNKFELQVGPTPMNDFVYGSDQTMTKGVIYKEAKSQISFSPGQRLNENCMVVAVETNKHFVTPLEKITVPALPFPFSTAPLSVPIDEISPRKPMPPPDDWDLDAGTLVELSEGAEKTGVVNSFFSLDGGLDFLLHEIVNIKRYQNVPMWKSYAKLREKVAAENWGIVNEQRLFHGTKFDRDPMPMFSTDSPDFFYNEFRRTQASQDEVHLSHRSSFGNSLAYRDVGQGLRQMLFSRVTLGRVDDHATPRVPQLSYYLARHSVLKSTPLGTVYAVPPSRFYPEYIITYKAKAPAGRRIVRSSAPGPLRAARAPVSTNMRTLAPSRRQTTTPVAPTPPAAAAPLATSTAPAPSTPGSPPSTKLCVVCWDRPVSHVLVPCGHPSLCQLCATPQGISKLRKKCPECRSPIHQVIQLYGRIVED